MRNVLILLISAMGIAGCSFNMPGFLGSSSNDGTFQFGGDEIVAVPEPLFLSSTHVERTSNGVILRAEGIAPTQGWYSAALLASGTSAAEDQGIYSLDFVAVPPEQAIAIGPERTRELRAAIFLPDRYLRRVTSVQITGRQRTDTVTLR